jgi:hypothetical protein
LIDPLQQYMHVCLATHINAGRCCLCSAIRRKRIQHATGASRIFLTRGFILHTAKHVVFAALLLTLPLEASATLGGDAGTTQADQIRMKATLRVSRGAGYSVHEMSLPTGTTVREYVSPQGQVFAVTWKGPLKPDLRQLMGDYFDIYLQAVPDYRTGHGAARVSLPDLVVHSMGHMRAFTGHAYLPAMLPGGFALEELQ